MQEKRSAVPMDICIDPSQQDILSPCGFSNLLVHVMSLEPGSGKFTAPVCASWIFLSGAKSQDVFTGSSKHWFGFQNIVPSTYHQKMLVSCDQIQRVFKTLLVLSSQLSKMIVYVAFFPPIPPFHSGREDPQSAQRPSRWVVKTRKQ